MRVAGIAAEIPTRGRPVVRVVIVNDASGSPVVESVTDVTTDATDVATQLHDTAESIRSRLTGLDVDRVVLRRADRPPRPSNAEGPRLRLLVEGAVASASKSVVIDTRIGTGRDAGAWYGSNKAGVDAAAAQLVSGRGTQYVEAGSAALAALALT